jgi:hypothetical protein
MYSPDHKKEIFYFIFTDITESFLSVYYLIVFLSNQIISILFFISFIYILLPGFYKSEYYLLNSYLRHFYFFFFFSVILFNKNSISIQFKFFFKFSKFYSIKVFNIPF